MTYFPYFLESSLASLFLPPYATKNTKGKSVWQQEKSLKYATDDAKKGVPIDLSLVIIRHFSTLRYVTPDCVSQLIRRNRH